MGFAKQRKVTILVVVLGLVALACTGLAFRGPLLDWYGLWRYPWGNAEHGIQVRLRPEKDVWLEGESPTFLVDLRNGSTKPLTTSAVSALLLEVDGEHFAPWAWSMTGTTPRTSIQPGTEHRFTFSLNQFTSQGLGFSPGDPVLEPGAHVIKVVLLHKGLNDPAFFGGPDDGIGREFGVAIGVGGVSLKALAFSSVVKVTVAEKVR